MVYQQSHARYVFPLLGDLKPTTLVTPDSALPGRPPHAMMIGHMRGLHMMLTTVLGLSFTILAHLDWQIKLDGGKSPPSKPGTTSEPADTGRLKTIVWDFGILAPGTKHAIASRSRTRPPRHGR
jgi:hypothetical protein